MNATTQVDLRQIEAVGRLLQAGLSDLRTPLDRCGIVLQRSTDLRFASGGGDEVWASLSPVTEALRRQGPNSNAGNKPLQDTGRLRQSVTWRSAGGGAAPDGAIYELTPDVLTYGTNVEYASIHQNGGTITVKKAKVLAVPLRDPIDLGGKKSGTLAGRRVSSYNGQQYLILGKQVTVRARPFLYVTDQDVDDFQVVFSMYLNEILSGGRP